MVIIFVSGALNGSFALPMKHARRWRWENTWLVFTFLSLAVLPWLLAVSFVPRLEELYHQVPHQAVIYPLAFGFLWGIAQATYGIGISAVGMALAVAVVSGLTCLTGSLIPFLVLAPGELLQPRGILLLTSIPILLLGLFFYGRAGRRREREQPARPPEKSGISYSSAAGLAICIFTGVLGSAWNLGFAFSGPLIRRSAELGAASLVAPYAVWVLVLPAGFIPSLLYCAYLLSRNGTWRLFGGAGWVREAMLSAAMALLWLAGIVGYGIGATFVGRYGTSIGFALFAAALILSANMLGVLSGEWKATSARTKRVLTAAVALTLASVVVLNLGGLF
jgi:L-rhamnose-H+ transport protein